MNGQMKDEPEKDLLSRVMLQDWCKREARLGIYGHPPAGLLCLWASTKQQQLLVKARPLFCDLIAICFFVWPIILFGHIHVSSSLMRVSRQFRVASNLQYNTCVTGVQGAR